MTYTEGVRAILAGQTDSFAFLGSTFTRSDALVSLGRDKAHAQGFGAEYDEVILGIHPEPRPAARA